MFLMGESTGWIVYHNNISVGLFIFPHLHISIFSLCVSPIKIFPLFLLVWASTAHYVLLFHAVILFGEITLFSNVTHNDHSNLFGKDMF